MLKFLLSSTSFYHLMDEADPDGGGGGSGGGSDPAGGASGTPAPRDLGGGAADPAAGAGDPANPNPAATEFKVPDAYKDAPWAAKVKTSDDLWKQLENTNKLIGQKRAAPPADATPEQLEEFYSASRPASVEEYGLPDLEGMRPEFKSAIGDILMKNGLTAAQGKAVFDDYTKAEAAEYALATSDEGWKAETKNSFGDDAEKTVASVIVQHKQHLSPEDQKKMEALPNDILGLVYRLTNNMAKAYGANEGIDKTGKGGVVAPVDLDKSIMEVRNKMTELKSRPHSTEEYDALKTQLDGFYQQKVKQGK